jgi:hypothetical protein
MDFSIQATNSSSPTDNGNISVRVRTSKRKTFREYFYELSAELRCLVYDAMVSHRVIEVLQPKEHRSERHVDHLKRKQHLLDTDAIHQLYTAEKNLEDDILKWLNARKELRWNSEVGTFDPRNAIFLLDFQWLPLSRHFEKDPVWAKMRRLSDYTAWDEFSHSELYTTEVRHLQINLNRYHIFTDEQECMESTWLDLRSLRQFRYLECIDFFVIR